MPDHSHELHDETSLERVAADEYYPPDDEPATHTLTGVVPPRQAVIEVADQEIASQAAAVMTAAGFDVIIRVRPRAR